MNETSPTTVLFLNFYPGLFYTWNAVVGVCYIMEILLILIRHFCFLLKVILSIDCID